MVNLFINTAVQSLRETVKTNTSIHSATLKTSITAPKATVKTCYSSTPSPTNSTTVFYVGYDSFLINHDDEDETEAKTALENTTDKTLRHTQLVDTTVVTSPRGVKKYIEKLRDLISFNTANDSKSTTIKGKTNINE